MEIDNPSMDVNLSQTENVKSLFLITVTKTTEIIIKQNVGRDETIEINPLLCNIVSDSW